MGCFCEDVELEMVDESIHKVNQNKVNRGGLSLGKGGETVKCIKLDDFPPSDVDIGFIHCDAQGSEKWIFHGAQNLIRRCKPVILYEDVTRHGPELEQTVKESYPDYVEQGNFDFENFCKELGYADKIAIGTVNSLLLPPKE